MRELEEFNFLKLVLAEDAARVFPSRSSFGTETSRPGRDVNGQLFLRNGLVAIQIVKLNLGRRGEPEVRAFQVK